jgi:hypothetical protein
MKQATLALMIVLLAGCGGDSGTDSQSAPQPADASAEPAAEASTEAATEYQEKVRQKVSDSVVNSLVREWNASEEAVRCVLAKVRPSQLAMAATDTEVRKIIEECGVDLANVR